MSFGAGLRSALVRHRLWLLLALVATLALAWLPGYWKEYQEAQDFFRRQRIAKEQHEARRAAWEREHPDKHYDNPAYRARVLQLPPGMQVADVWLEGTEYGDAVLLTDGTVLLRDDVMRLVLDPIAPLPKRPFDTPSLRSLERRTGVSLWTDGRVDAKGVHGREAKPWSVDPYRRGIYHYTYADLRPKEGSKEVIDTLDDVVAASAGRTKSFAVVLRRNGQVHAFGQDNAFGQLGSQKPGADGVPGFVLDRATAIAVGDRHALALRDDGSVWMWGQMALAGGRGTPIPPEAVQPQPRRVELPGRIVKIAAGAGTGYALTDEGNVWAWGATRCSALGVQTDTVPPQERIMDVVYWRGSPEAYAPVISKPRQVQGPENVIDIQAGSQHAVALTKDGRLWAWGRNQDYRMGFAESKSVRYNNDCDVWPSGYPMSPFLVGGVKDVRQVFLSERAVAYVTTDGTLGHLGACGVCSEVGLRSGVAVHLVRKWAHIAAKGMWCGRVAAVTDMRKASFNFLEETYREPYERTFYGFAHMLKGSRRSMPAYGYFLWTAKEGYLEGFDDDTAAMRRRAGSERVPPLSHQTDRSRVWWEALDFGGDVTREAKLSGFSVRTIAEEQAQFEREQCPAIDAQMREVMSEIDRHTKEAERYIEPHI
jgi:Regulator of chromosome condensation (RCC1) repeat